MKLQFNYDIERDDIEFDIIIDNEIKRIDYCHNSVIFELSPGYHTITLKQIWPAKINKIIASVLYLLTIVLYALIVGFLNSYSNEKPYSNIDAFYISANYEVYLEKDLIVDMKYTSSKYNKLKKVRSYPKLVLEGLQEINIEYIPDKLCIKTEFFNHCKGLLSAAVDSLILFGIFLYLSFTIGNIKLSLFLILLICAFMGLFCYSFLWHRKKSKSLHEEFIKQLETGLIK